MGAATANQQSCVQRRCRLVLGLQAAVCQPLGNGLLTVAERGAAVVAVWSALILGQQCNTARLLHLHDVLAQS
jgi:hypothetical protein